MSDNFTCKINKDEKIYKFSVIKDRDEFYNFSSNRQYEIENITVNSCGKVNISFLHGNFTENEIKKYSLNKEIVTASYNDENEDFEDTIFHENSDILYIMGHEFVITDIYNQVKQVKNGAVEIYPPKILDNEFIIITEVEEEDSKKKEEQKKRISKILRRSETLNFDTFNQFSGNRYTVVFDKKGIAILYKSFCDINKVFDDITILYLLCIAYNLQNDNYIQEINNAVKNFTLTSQPSKENYQLVDTIKEKILMFDFKYFFNNPVKFNRIEYYPLWDFLAKNLNVIPLHNEVKGQCLDLTEYLEIYYNKLLLQEKEKELKRREEQEELNRNFQKIMTYAGILIAFFTFWASAITTYPILKSFFE